MLSRTRYTLIAVSAVASLSALALSGCNSGDAKTNEEAKPALNVRVETLRPQPLVDALPVAGIVKAYEDVMLSPEEGGVVKEWRVEKGRRVSKGELLVVLRDEVVKASYEAAEAQYQLAKLNAEKQEKVYAEQGISELQYKNLLYGRDAAKANADLMKARWERTQIKSPVSGILDEQYFDAGEFAPPGVPIAHVVNLSTLKITAEIPERYAASISVGTPMQITFDSMSNDTLRARVNFVGSTVNASNRALTIEATLSDPTGRLKPEMIAKILVLRAARSNALLVNQNAVQLVDRDRRVLYVERDGKAEQRVVTLGVRQGTLVEVTSGVQAGDRVITTDVQKLVEGTPVAVVQ